MKLDAIEHAMEHYDDSKQERAIEKLADTFFDQIRTKNVSDVADFAPQITVFEAGGLRRKRDQTIAEVMTDALDDKVQITKLLKDLAFGSDCKSELAARARNILTEATYKWARINYSEGEE